MKLCELRAFCQFIPLCVTEFTRPLLREGVRIIHEEGETVYVYEDLSGDFKMLSSGTNAMYSGGTGFAFFLVRIEGRVWILNWNRFSTDINENHTQADAIVRVAARLAAREMNATELFLYDNTRIYYDCPPMTGKAIVSGLSFDCMKSYQFFITGKTWYEGLLPGVVPVNNAKEYEERKRVFQSLTWGEFIAKHKSVQSWKDIDCSMNAIEVMKQRPHDVLRTLRCTTAMVFPNNSDVWVYRCPPLSPIPPLPVLPNEEPVRELEIVDLDMKELVVEDLDAIYSA